MIQIKLIKLIYCYNTACFSKACFNIARFNAALALPLLAGFLLFTSNYSNAAQPLGCLIEPDSTAVHLHEAGQALEQRGLARAVRSDQAEHLAAHDIEGDVINRDQATVGLAQ